MAANSLDYTFGFIPDHTKDYLSKYPPNDGYLYES